MMRLLRARPTGCSTEDRAGQRAGDPIGNPTIFGPTGKRPIGLGYRVRFVGGSGDRERTAVIAIGRALCLTLRLGRSGF